MLQVVVHADHVVAALELAGELLEAASIGLLDPAEPCRFLDGRTLVEPVERGGRQDFLGSQAEVRVPGPDVQPPLGLGERLDHARPAVVRLGLAGEHRFGRRLAEAVVEVAVVEAQAFLGQPGVLPDVSTSDTPVHRERAGLALHQVRRRHPAAQVCAAARRAVVAPGLVEVLVAVLLVPRRGLLEVLRLALLSGGLLATGGLQPQVGRAQEPRHPQVTRPERGAGEHQQGVRPVRGQRDESPLPVRDQSPDDGRVADDRARDPQRRPLPELLERRRAVAEVVRPGLQPRRDRDVDLRAHVVLDPAHVRDELGRVVGVDLLDELLAHQHGL